MAKQEKKKGSWKRILLGILCVILALVLVALLGITMYVEHLYNQIPTVNTETMSPSQASEQILARPTETIPTDYTGEVLDPSDVTIPTQPAPVIIPKDDVINILLVGQDRRSGQGRMHSDAMILCTVNKTKKTVYLTSFMRDMYVYVDGYWNERINTAYMYGGFKTLNDTLEYNFGFRADHNIEVDFDGFEQIIDMVGGVYITLTSNEADYMNWQNYTWGMVSGVNLMNGEQALAYARNRDIGDDFGRTQRQRNVLTALIKQAMTLDLVTLNNLVNSVLPMVATDMELQEVTKIVAEVFPILTQLEIRTQQIPADGTYVPTYVGNKAVLIPNLEKNIAILEKILGEDLE